MLTVQVHTNVLPNRLKWQNIAMIKYHADEFHSLLTVRVYITSLKCITFETSIQYCNTFYAKEKLRSQAAEEPIDGKHQFLFMNLSFSMLLLMG